MVEEATEADDPVLTQLMVVGSNISSLVTQAQGPTQDQHVRYLASMDILRLIVTADLIRTIKFQRVFTMP